MGPIGCPETSVRNYHYTLRNNAEQSSSYILYGGSLKLRNEANVFTHDNPEGWKYSSLLIKIQADATVCRYLFTAKSLYMFRVSQHPSSGVLKTVAVASGTGHNIGTATSLQRGLIRPRFREVAVPVLWPVPEAKATVFSTPDDGCCDTRNM